MIFTKERVLRIINEEIEAVKESEIEFKGEPMHHQGQEFQTGLGSMNTPQDYADAPPTIGVEGGGMIDEDLLAIAMRIRDKIMPQVGPVITGALADAQAALQSLAAKLQEEKKRK